MVIRVRDYLSDTSGATLLEYSLIASLVAVFIATAVQTVGGNLSNALLVVGATLK